MPHVRTPRALQLPTGPKDVLDWLKQSLSEERKAVEMLMQERHEALLANVSDRQEAARRNAVAEEQLRRAARRQADIESQVPFDFGDACEAENGDICFEEEVPRACAEPVVADIKTEHSIFELVSVEHHTHLSRPSTRFTKSVHATPKDVGVGRLRMLGLQTSCDQHMDGTGLSLHVKIDQAHHLLEVDHTLSDNSNPTAVPEVHKSVAVNDDVENLVDQRFVVDLPEHCVDPEKAPRESRPEEQLREDLVAQDSGPFSTDRSGGGSTSGPWADVSTSRQNSKDSRKPRFRTQATLLSKVRDAQMEKEREAHSRWQLWVMGSGFELLFGGLILMNTGVMALEAQYNGFDLGKDIGLPGYTLPASQVWPNMDEVFQTSESVFGILFVIEASLKLAATRWRYFKSFWNWFDALIILFWSMDKAIAFEYGNPLFLRVIRMFRLLRLLRLAKTFQAFDVLHIMLGSLKASIYALIWSLALLILIMLMGALLVNFLVSEKLADEATPEVVRIQLFTYFGSFSRGFLSMFELTLGNWVPITRYLHENVHEAFGPAILVYHCMISFSVIKVISGVFLHETFKVASTDDELMIMQKKRQMMRHIQKIHQLFEEADESGQGYLSASEFCEVMADPRVKAWLSAMDLDVQDAHALFALVDDGDRKVNAYELVSGFARLKGGAKSLDLNTLMMQCGRIEELLLDMAGGDAQSKEQAKAKRSKQRFRCMTTRDFTHLLPAEVKRLPSH